MLPARTAFTNTKHACTNFGELLTKGIIQINTHANTTHKCLLRSLFTLTHTLILSLTLP